MVVNNKFGDTSDSDIIGIIRGSLEPDRSRSVVQIVGNHCDAWGYGASDPSSGMAALMEMARVEKVRGDRRPRTSLVLASWVEWSGAWTRYTTDSQSVKSSMDLEDTGFEIFYLMDKLADPGFKISKASTQLGLHMTLQLAEAPVLPYSITDMTRVIEGTITDLQNRNSGRKKMAYPQPPKISISG